MVTYEHNTLVLDPANTKADQDAINSFVADSIQKERERILSDLEAEARGYSTLSIALFKLRNIVNNKEGLSS